MPQCSGVVGGVGFQLRAAENFYPSTSATAEERSKRRLDNAYEEEGADMERTEVARLPGKRKATKAAGVGVDERLRLKTKVK